MLPNRNRPVIEATLPVVGEIPEIAQRFYRHLFDAHPDLLDGTFNRGNQARGEQQQALAGSVAAFASTLVATPERVPESTADGEHRQFTVKRVSGRGEPDGEMSTLLHDGIGIGDVLTMSLPYGDVVLDDAGRPVVFVSAGIGIAPMAGMLSHLVAAGSGLSITLLHADADEASLALRRQVVTDVLALRNASLHLWYDHQDHSNEPVAGVRRGPLDLGAVDLPEDATYYLCGPVPFMQAVRSSLIERGVLPHDIQYEVFGPDLWQADVE